MRRLAELDAFRGIAAITVLLFHYTTKYNEAFGTPHMQYEFSYGHYGVQLFFVISGFVIFMTINKVGSGMEFARKRFMRLYPTFWICMILTFVITRFGGLELFQRTMKDFLLNFTMIPSRLGAKPVDGAYWSLFPELLFYAFILVVYQLRQLRNIELISAAWLGITILLLMVYPNKMLIMLTNARYSFLFIAGISFYRLRTESARSLANHLLILASAAVSYLAGGLELLIVTSICFALFYLFVYGKLAFLGSIRALTFLGMISYPLYLVHQFAGMQIIYHMGRAGIDNYFLLLLAPLTFSVVTAWLITRYFEGRLLRSFQKNKAPGRMTSGSVIINNE